jgi:hypothetical protein
MASKILLVLAAALVCGGQTSLPFTHLPFTLASVPFDNKLVRVQLSAGLPGVITPPHVHLTNRVMIYLDAGTNKITYPNGKVSPEVFRAGDVQWNDAMGSHTAEIIAAAPVNIVHIELKSPPNGVPAVPYSGRDPVKVDPGHYKVEIDNNQVRVLRLHLKPGDKTVLHEEPFERLLVPLTAVRLKVADAEGKTKTFAYGRAQLQWLPAGAEADENIGGRPYEALIVEFKK